MLNLEDFPYEDVLTLRFFLKYNFDEGILELPPKAALELKKLLDSSDITNIEDYKQALNKIVEIQNQWQFSEIKFSVLFDIVLPFVIFLFLYFVYSKFKQPLDVFFNANKNICIQIIAASGYIFPYIEGCAAYSPMLVGKFPYIHLILPPFVLKGIEIYKNTTQPNLLYTFIVFIVLLGNRIPRNRFIRFHWMYGILLTQMQHFVFCVYYPVMYYLEDNAFENAMRGIALVLMIILLIYIVPAIIYSLTGRYIKDYFLRDCCEIHLGRDDDPDFTWWDRKKKK